MELTTVREIFRDREKYLNKEIQVGGWVRSNRDSKAFGFLVLHDGTFFETLQIVYHDTMANFQELTKINVGAAVIVKGTLVPTPEAKQPFEIQAEEISIEGASTPDYPLQKKRHSLEYMRTITHLRPRTNFSNCQTKAEQGACLCHVPATQGRPAKRSQTVLPLARPGPM